MARRRGEPWKDWEVEYVQENYYKLDIETIVKHLGRTKSAIRNMAFRLEATTPKCDSLPAYCEGCGRKVNRDKCAGWKDPTGCMGDFYATRKEVERLEEERRNHVEKIKTVGESAGGR